MLRVAFEFRLMIPVKAFWLPILAFSAILIGVAFASQSFAQSKIDKDALIKAYAQLENEVFIGGYESEHKCDCDGKLIEKSSQVVKCGAKGFVVVTTDHFKNENQSVLGLNQNYAFRMRREKDKKWLIELARERSDPAVKSEFDANQRSIRQHRIPVLFHRRITDYLHAPSFQIREVGAEVRDGLKLVIIEFSCDHATIEGRDFPEIKAGQMKLMRDFGFYPVESSLEAKYPSDNSFSSITKSFEYDVSDPQRPLITKTIQETSYINAPDRQLLREVNEYKYQSIGIEPRYRDFTMQAFGLDELDYFSEQIK